MKAKITLLVLFFALCGLSMKAQTQLWGICTQGGVNGQGTIFTANGDGTNFHKVYDFVNSTGAWPLGNMTLANNGSFYGVTELGGFGDSCVCYRYDPLTGIYTNIHDLFQFQSLGYGPVSRMLNANDGKLYGLCPGGGANGKGAIYTIDPGNDIYTDIFDFSNANGSYPCGSLIQGSNGNLYGFTSHGGINDMGVIFMFNPVTNVYTILYDFILSSGGNPTYGCLLEANDGKLYGVNDYGGANSDGVIYSYDLSTDLYSNLYNFNFPGSYAPHQSGLIQASDGKLYGTFLSSDSSNYGFIYSFDINTNNFADVYDFNLSDGAYSKRSLKLGSNGKLFGTTMGGGIYNKGVVYSYDISNSTYTKLTDFDGTNLGMNPDCELNEVPAFMTVGISSLNSSILKIFPNPAGDFINISNSDKEETITLTDVLGRELETLKTNAFSKTHVDVSSFPNVFFVKSSDGVEKVMKR